MPSTDLMERFRQFQARSKPVPSEFAAPSGCRVGQRLPGGEWVWWQGPRGQVPMRETRLPLPFAAALDEEWPSRIAGADLGPSTRWVWLDVETTGLRGSGVQAFLVALGRIESEGIVVRQLLLEAPDREPALWAASLDLLKTATAVVTFNGKAFDWPLLRDRCIMAGVPAPPDLPHWDLLALARRLWGHTLTDVQLSTLGAVLLGERRQAEPSGEEIGACYWAFLQGQGEALAGVVRRNERDVVTLAGVAALTCAMLSAGAKGILRLVANSVVRSGAQAEGGGEGGSEGVTTLPAGWAGWASVSAEALLVGMGEVYEGLDEAGRALECYWHAARVPAADQPGPWGRTSAGALEPYRRRAVRAAGRVLKRLGRYDEAAHCWAILCAQPWPTTAAAVELAKYLEHRRRDPEAALALVRRALRWGSRLPAGSAQQQDLQRRLVRLAAKVERARGRPAPEWFRQPGPPPSAHGLGLGGPCAPGGLPDEDVRGGDGLWPKFG